MKINQIEKRGRPPKVMKETPREEPKQAEEVIDLDQMKQELLQAQMTDKTTFRIASLQILGKIAQELSSHNTQLNEIKQILAAKSGLDVETEEDEEDEEEDDDDEEREEED